MSNGQNRQNLPTEPPAIGGWYWDTKAQQSRFLMPPYPGVDDCVKTPRGWAYRRLAERDKQRVAETDNSVNEGDGVNGTI